MNAVHPAVDPHGPFAPQEAAPPVHQGVSAVESARYSVESRVSMLEERLQPVLGPVSEPPALAEAPVPAPRSDLAAVLFTNGELLEGLAVRLARLLDRLEV
jgi:hypothetical protein